MSSYTSDTIRRLQTGRHLAWQSLKPVFDWAIHEAREAEYRAAVVSDQVQAGIPPTYPVIVTLLAEAAEGLGPDPRPDCLHEAWEVLSTHSRRCADCREYLPEETP